MLLQAFLELRILHFADQLGQRLFDELPLDVEDVAELMEEELSRTGDLRHSNSFRYCRRVVAGGGLPADSLS